MNITLTGAPGADTFSIHWSPPHDIARHHATRAGWDLLWSQSIAPQLIARMSVWAGLGSGSVTMGASSAGSIEGLSQGAARDAVAFLLRLAPGAILTAPAWVTEPAGVSMNGRAPGADA